VQAINTAELTPTSSIPGDQLPLQTAAVTVKIVPNCAANAGRQAVLSHLGMCDPRAGSNIRERLLGWLLVTGLWISGEAVRS
jgi:hypothetical protein